MAAEAPSVAQPQSRTTQRQSARRSKTATPVWVAGIAAIIAIIANVVALGGHHGTQIAVAARDLAPAEPVGTGDFRLIDATLPASALGQMIHPADLSALAGQVTTHAITAGQPLTRSDLSPTAAPGRQRAMSIPVDPTHAVGGRLQRGDVVDVVDAASGIPSYVVIGAPVIDVGTKVPGASAYGGGSSKYALTIAVDSAAALRLADAIANGKLEVVRSTGAVPVAVAR